MIVFDAVARTVMQLLRHTGRAPLLHSPGSPVQLGTKRPASPDIDSHSHYNKPEPPRRNVLLVRNILINRDEDFEAMRFRQNQKPAIGRPVPIHVVHGFDVMIGKSRLDPRVNALV